MHTVSVYVVALKILKSTSYNMCVHSSTHAQVNIPPAYTDLIVNKWIYRFYNPEYALPYGSSAVAHNLPNLVNDIRKRLDVPLQGQLIQERHDRTRYVLHVKVIVLIRCI